ncbi:MAG TPA: NADH-quinone oxidoreductase subunit I [Phycisphaerae bacterium]|nr:NADH-quinone oxidoreductase subunit I [Phycisphaerae bacterium]
MPCMKPEDILELQPPKLTAAENAFIPAVLGGLGTTITHMFQSLGGKVRTIQYPEDRREDHPVLEHGMDTQRYRGVHRLNRDEQGRVKCVACYMCATACPAHCIHIVGDAAPPSWPDREKYPIKFDIDELRCIYCGMCEEACPVDAIEMTYEYDIVGMTREEMIFDKEKLLAIYDQTIQRRPM